MASDNDEEGKGVERVDDDDDNDDDDDEGGYVVDYHLPKPRAKLDNNKQKLGSGSDSDYDPDEEDEDDNYYEDADFGMCSLSVCPLVLINKKVNKNRNYLFHWTKLFGFRYHFIRSR